MKFSINQKDLQESLGFCQNVIERRSTLPILSNVLIEAKNKILKIKLLLLQELEKALEKHAR